METTALDRTHRSTHGGNADRLWHTAHGQRCHDCWPATGGLPALPDTTAGPHWLAELIAAEFGTDIPKEVAA